MAKELHPCPYSVATRCSMEDPCLGCESFIPNASDKATRQCDFCECEAETETMVAIESEHGDRTAYLCGAICATHFIQERTPEPKGGRNG